MGGANLLFGNWNFLKQQMTEENMLKIFMRNVCVGDEGTMCSKENEVKAVFSRSFLSLRGYDVTKKA